MVINNKGTPIKPNSKNEKPSIPASNSALLAIMLGGVPVSVKSPPVLEPNAMGIKSFEGSVPAFQAADTVTGSSAATVPVLLTNPERSPDPKVTITNSFEVLFRAQETNLRPARAVQPVLERPSPMMNKAAIIITVGLLKPLRVSFKSRIPKRKRAIIESSATTSGGNLPHTKRTMVILKIIKTETIEYSGISRWPAPEL